MNWRKLGHVYCPDGSRPWARTHALMPTAQLVDGERLRVYYAGLDDKMRGHIGVLELDANDPQSILYDADKPVLSPGRNGAFDDCGVNPSCIVRTDNGEFLYYLGWHRGAHEPYSIFAGAARILPGRDDAPGPTLERVRETPVLGKSDSESVLRSATTIVPKDGRFTCYYVAGDRWVDVRGRPCPSYAINSVISNDTLSWPDHGRRAVDLKGKYEFGLGRPWVMKAANGYRLFYSIRSTNQPYRIGYAVSADGETWQRRDDLKGLDRSENGWDSEMICYASVIDTGVAQYMFYNGNQHGRTGFGVAVLEQE